MNRMVLFSGMGADERIFLPQTHRFPDTTVCEWIAPLSMREPIREYAQRLIAENGWQSSDQLAFGGASFGGVIAQEIAHELKAPACILMGSMRSIDGIPTSVRLGGRIASPLLPFVPMRPILWLLTQIPKSKLPLGVRGFLTQAQVSDPDFLRWAIRALLRWKPPADYRTPTFQIHGRQDWILPAKLATRADLMIDGGHIISMTQGPAVNQFIRESLASLGLEIRV
ncbi:MAG: alpha/beta hydrolase [Verrucomicrobiota bacterium]